MEHRSIAIALAGCWVLAFVQMAFASSPLCSITQSGGQACKIYKIEDCQNLVDIPLVRNVQCPAAFNGVQDILKVVSLKAHAPHFDGHMEFYIDDITLARSNNTCKQKSQTSPSNENMPLSATDAVCHALTTLTSPGAKASWLQGALRPLPTLLSRFLAARPTSMLTFSQLSPTWNSLINQMGIATEMRYVVESTVDLVKSVLSTLVSPSKHDDVSHNQFDVNADGGGGWGGGIFLSNGQKAVDFGGGGGGGISQDSQGGGKFRADGGAECVVMEHESSAKSQYFPTLGVSGRSNGMDVLPTYKYIRDSTQAGYKSNITTTCYDKDILGEYLMSIQDIYQELKETYASGGVFVVQGGGGQGAGLQFNLPGGVVNAFSTSSGFMFDYSFYNPDQVRSARLLADPYENLYKELGRIYQEASQYAASVCENSTDPMCQCQARYEYVLQESKQYADPLPIWITTNTCQSDSTSNSCKNWLL